MILKKTSIHGCLKILPIKKRDLRGSFHRSFCKDKLRRNKIKFDIKQCNVSINLKKHTLRGFHFQKKPYTENKILKVIKGSIYNITIDLRKKSKTFMKKYITTMNELKNDEILIPAGCANAFLTLEKNTIIHYYMDSFFEKNSKNNYSGIRFDDKYFNIRWPHKPKVISKKDKNFKSFSMENI
tara:strand:+ start:316 stop:864 length:549 start_codon:yes stop_codon:yes gene_type:complete